MKSILISTKAPKPVGPYSQAVSYGEFIYTSGQVGINTEGKFVSGEIQDQTRQVLENLKSILEDNGSSLENVIKTTVYLKDMNDFKPMNEIYAGYFGNSLPARSTVAVAGLPLDARVEIEVIAFKK